MTPEASSSLDTLMAYYREDNANAVVVCTLAERATAAYEASRENFVSLSMPNQPKRSSITWNDKLVLTGLVPCRAGSGARDEVVISIMGTPLKYHSLAGSL